MVGLNPFDVLSWIGTALFTIALLPQGVRTWRRKRADDISVWFLLTILGASASMFVWAISIDRYVVSSGYIANLVVWGYVLRIRLWPAAPPEPEAS